MLSSFEVSSMSIAQTSPITGQPQTGFTSPTYTTVVDTAPPGNPGKQVVVTALGGTQAGVTTHSVASPFTINFTRPASLKILGNPNPITGVVSLVPTNTYKAITRKGVLPLAGQPFKVLNVTTSFDVPAGSDTADAPNIRAAVSAHLGALVQQSAGIGDMLVNGVL
ncbi:coat protein [ssRNA phage Zoerhiza.1_36]|uniref:Coat protein n=2 Tax=Norzivirales TaxID=2842247 RepID=A0A8S5KZ92_9VIRU|nr:coat protein [ssRNA phage Zoerhiza.1_36]DAD50397.1 TPA_asm: coat protein [ssRNA phage Zoerhiza.1_36]